MSDEEAPPETEYEQPPEDSNVLVFRNNSGRPVAVPSDVVTEGERAYRCYELRKKGLPWDQIAKDEGYPSATAARADVDRYMAVARSLVVERSARDMLTMEISRLDALQVFMWPAAESGHVPSALAIRAFIMDRAKLAGLDPEKMNEDLAESARTVVVREDSYIQGLQRAAGESTDLQE